MVVKGEPVLKGSRTVRMKVESRVQHLSTVNEATGLEGAASFAQDFDGLLDVLEKPADKSTVKGALGVRQLESVPDIKTNSASSWMLLKIFLCACNLASRSIDALDFEMRKALQ